MSFASRRIIYYWLLLLLPTLVVGAGAILLLRREQHRLAEKASYADEARNAAVAARARLVAESVELITGDIQEGLLDTLAAVPAQELDSFLEEFERTNPFVRVGFLVGADHRLERPSESARGEARGFVRRFNVHWGSAPPWGNVMVHDRVEEALRAKRVESELEAQTLMGRSQITANVAKRQLARRDAQLSSRQGPTSFRADAPEKVSVPMGDRASQPAAAAMAKEAEAESGGKKLFGMEQPERRGWSSRVIDGRLHLIGWVKLASEGRVRGVEVEVAALVARLMGALPAEVDAAEGYAILDEQARVVHQVGAVARNGEPVVRVALAESILPGWSVAGYFPSVQANASLDDGGGFFVVSSLLVGIFVAAILAGGALLLRQARRSELEAAQKTSFVANVSHEFKTPLTTIRLYAELLEQERVRSPEKRGEYLRTIGRETQRLSRLVGNVLDFSRLEQGQKRFKLEEVDLTAELSQLLDTQTPRFTEAGLHVLRELPSQPTVAKIDRDAFGQILLNLIENVCKYAALGGELLVELGARAGGGVVVRVMDRGPGVPDAHREKIFEKFHRVDDTLTAEKGGAGLGLSIARQLAEGMGGRLSYAPREGGGAVFSFELP